MASVCVIFWAVLFYWSLVLSILGAFLIKQLFHSRLLDMRWQETLSNVNGSFSNCDFNVTNVIVKHSAALHPRSSKTNQGRPKERKGCPCSNPGNCLRVMFSFLGDYQLSQSTMVSYAFLPHPSSSCKYKRRKRAMLNILYSPRVQPLLVIPMD